MNRKIATCIKDVAKQAGVSTATVSRVLNRDPVVTLSTQEKVYAAMASLNYVPNVAARILAGGKSGAIGCMIPEFIGPVFSVLLSSIETTLRQENIHVLATTGRADAEKERDAISFLNARAIDGLILFSETLSDSELIQIAHRTPTVFLQRALPTIENQCVFDDNIQAMQVLVKYLVSKQYKNAMMISGPRNKTDGVTRSEGALRAAKQYNLNIIENFYGDFTIAQGYQIMKHILTLENRPEVVICGNDETALGALKAMQEQGLKCPEDIALTGFDDIPNLASAVTEITTLRMPAQELGQEAAKLIMNMVYQKSFTVQHCFESKLVKRSSA